MFLVVGHQVCTHLRRDFVPLLLADPLQVIKVLRLTFGNSNLQLPPQIFYGIKVWRLVGHSRTLMCFFLSHSFVALVVCFGSSSCWNTHPWSIFNALAGFNALALTVHGPDHHPFDVVQLSCPLSRKTPPTHISTSMFDGGDGVLWVIGILLQTRQVELMPKSSIMVSSDLNTFTQFSSESLTNFRWACTYGPPCSSGLIPHHSNDHWNSRKWGEILHGASVRGRLTTVVTFPPNSLAMVLQPISAFCRSTILSLTSLDSFWSGPWRRVWNLINWLLLWTDLFHTGDKLRLCPLRECS